MENNDGNHVSILGEVFLNFRIPTYIITALYLGPAGVWLYWRYGRPKVSSEMGEEHREYKPEDQAQSPEFHEHKHQGNNHGNEDVEKKRAIATEHMPDPPMLHHQQSDVKHESHPHGHTMNHDNAHMEKLPSAAEVHMHHHSKQTVPFYVSVLIGVTHCGAGCVLGDIVGEWIVYSTNVSISSRSLYPEFLIDYALALLFGIAFQYFSIAPMSGDWGVRSVIRAAKADVLSLTAFELGLFGWMAIYQVGIWDWRLGMVNTVYWWMMQVGMCLGFVTSFPMNWYLVKWGIKEPHVM
jgi:hypothetical protein